MELEAHFFITTCGWVNVSCRKDLYQDWFKNYRSETVIGEQNESADKAHLSVVEDKRAASISEKSFLTEFFDKRFCQLRERKKQAESSYKGIIQIQLDETIDTSQDGASK